MDDCVAKYLWMKEMMERVAKVCFYSMFAWNKHTHWSAHVQILPSHPAGKARGPATAQKHRRHGAEPRRLAPVQVIASSSTQQQRCIRQPNGLSSAVERSQFERQTLPASGQSGVKKYYLSIDQEEV